ncbi:MAG: hypothetical protein H7A12_07215 [Pseudomonadales bacterium]|jgi:hypothetical protein|nr:hypothetical protein [Pseudomonadales bacterium]MCP5336656.1 hypothetical protein [Pseudomonadales bacterium]
MSDSQNVSMEPQRFFTGALNVLHAGFIAPSRVQAKRNFARIHGGAVLDLAEARLEDGSDLLFRVALDHGEFRGKLGFTVFRKALAQLLGKLSQCIRFKEPLNIYSSEETGALLLNLPAILGDDGQTNVMMLGVDKPETGAVTLRLQFLDPDQFRT